MGLFEGNFESLANNSFADGERALAFITGALLCLGTILYVIYTAPGFALIPVSLIKADPAVADSISAPNVRQELLGVQEEIRIIETRIATANGRPTSDIESRFLPGLLRRERTLLRKLHVEDENKRGSWLVRLKEAFRPVKVLAGVLILLFTILIWVSMLLTA